MFAGNAKLERGVKVMNAIEEGKFPLLLNRIAQSMISENPSKPFSEAEESKLVGSLEISKADVRLLIETIIEMFQLCAYYVVKPATLNEQLSGTLKLDPRKSEIFVQAWTSSAKGIVEHLKQKPFLPQVNHISYSISIETASDVSMKDKTPKAQLQIGLLDGNKRDDVNIEFSHEELYEFYNNLEQVQSQLDALR